MKRKGCVVLAIMLVMQILLSGLVTVNAEEETKELYTAPDGGTVTYNMNIDWKFFNTGTDVEIWTAMAKADKDGKKFYEKDYDDSDWQTVSIPHAITAESAFQSNITDAGGALERNVYLYRKTFTVPADATGKIVFELEGIRQAAYVWVNGQKLGYYEASITAMGFDLTNYVTPGEEAVIAICEDGTTARGTTGRIPYETVPGEEWGSSYTPDNYKTTVGEGVQFQWNTKDFNEPQNGLIYDAYLHVTKSKVYETLPLYNNLKTTGTYVYAKDFDIDARTATIGVKAEVRNETNTAGEYSIQVDVVDYDGYLKYSFESDSVNVEAATDAGVVYETAVEPDVYDDENVENPYGLTKVNTPDITYIEATYNAEELRFWSLDDPYLYTVYTILKDSDGNVVDVKDITTGFRKVTYDLNNGGLMINDESVWLPGYAQRATNEWAVIGSATDWLNDYDMKLLKENNSNFIRWMHVAPKPSQVRSTDKYGIAIACPAGDKEGEPEGRQWSQRTEAMRDAMIYFRNSPSILFWETGNSAISGTAAHEMADLRDTIDPHGMRFIGARSTGNSPDQLNYNYNYAGTMYGNYASNALAAMATNNNYGPIMETEYARDESPRRVWDDFSPPDYDYVNKYLGVGASKKDGYDVWDLTQEEFTINNIREYSNTYYKNRVGGGASQIYSAAAMMVWSDSNMHGRNSGTENSRTSGRVDAVRQTKESYYGTQTAQSTEPAVHIVGHWSYPQVSDDTYNYFEKEFNGTYWEYDKNTVLKRDPTKKTVYVIGSADVSKVELYRIDGEEETLIGTDASADSTFIYQFDGVDVTQGDAVYAKAYDAFGTQIATDRIDRTGSAVSVRLTPVYAPKTNESDASGWRADGSDIAFFDVEVIDENGNVCCLNYDRIDFTWEGEGVYLGGFNSGSGAGCFQNSAESTGLSFYFDGMKDGVSTIRKNYVYAENGTNRIFVRSTRTAGSFTLTAKMDGMQPVSATITSVPVEVTGGLTLQAQSTMEPGAVAEVIPEQVAPFKPLSSKTILAWNNFTTVTEEDDTVYYDVLLNDETLSLSPKARVGINNQIFGPVAQILDELKKLGAELTYTYDDTADKAQLAVTTNGHTYTFVESDNRLYIDGLEAANSELTEDMPTIEDNVMIAQLSSILGKIPGVQYSQNSTDHTFTITYSAN